MQSIRILAFFAAFLAATSLWAEPLQRQPIEAPLRYQYPIDAFAGSVSIPTSNHTSYELSIGRNTGNNGQQYGIQIIDHTYGGISMLTLNLETGEVVRKVTQPPYNGTFNTTVLKPSSEERDFLAYWTALDEIRRILVRFQLGKGMMPLPPRPELEKAVVYLEAVLKEVGNTPLAYEGVQANMPSTLRPGITYPIPVLYKAKEQRDLLVDLFIDKRWVTKARVTVAKGGGIVHIPLEVPSQITIQKEATVYIKLLPVGAPWQNKLAEATLSAWTYDKYLTVMNRTWNVDPSSLYEVSVIYSAPQTRRLRIELLDPNGQRVAAREQKIAAGIDLYIDRLSLETPATVFPGTYKILVKLLPEQGEEILEETSLEAPTKVKKEDGIYIEMRPYSVRPDFTNTLKISYYTTQARDLLVDLTIEDQVLFEQRISVQAGYRTVEVPILVPADVQPYKNGAFNVRLVPRGGDVSQTLEVGIQYAFTYPNNRIESSYGKQEAYAGQSYTYRVNYTTSIDRMVRIQLLDKATGVVLTEAVLDAPRGEYQQLIATLEMPGDLVKGQQLEFKVDLLAKGQVAEQPLHTYLDPYTKLTIQ